MLGDEVGLTISCDGSEAGLESDCLHCISMSVMYNWQNLTYWTFYRKLRQRIVDQYKLLIAVQFLNSFCNYCPSD